MSYAHIGELRLLEVRFDKNLVERHQHHQRLSRLHCLAHLRRPFRDHPIRRRAKFRVRKSQARFIAHRERLTNDRGLIRRRIDRYAEHCACLLHGAMGRVQLRLGCSERRVNFLDTFGRRRVARREPARPRVVEACLSELGLRETYRTVCHEHRRSALRDCLAGTRERGISLTQLHLEVGPIQADQRRTLHHRLVFLGEHFGDDTRDARGNEGDVGTDVRIVRGHMLAMEAPPPVQHRHQDEEHDDGADSRPNST